MKTSFIVISYNQEDYILDTLKGISSQTILPDEVIIADDASSDNTKNIIQDYIVNNPLINWKLILNSENLGITSNLRNAINQSCGDVLFINSGDDISYPNRIEKTLEYFSTYPEKMIVTGNLDIIDSQGVLIGEIINQEKFSNDIRATLKNGMPKIFPVGQAIRRELFKIYGQLPIDVPNEDDQLSFWGIISGGIKCMPDKIMKYRIHSKSASSWLRDKQNYNEFFNKFIIDMSVRKRHMELWKEALTKSAYKNIKEYNLILDSKIKIYSILENVCSVNFQYRIKEFLLNYKYISKKDSFYLICGKPGILFWRFLRDIIRK